MISELNSNHLNESLIVHNLENILIMRDLNKGELKSFLKIKYLILSMNLILSKLSSCYRTWLTICLQAKKMHVKFSRESALEYSVETMFITIYKGC